MVTKIEKKIMKMAFPTSRAKSIKSAVKKKMGVKEYRVWVSGSTQGHYIIANSVDEAISKLRRSDDYFKHKPQFEFRGMLWKTGKLYPEKHTPSAVKFRDSSGLNKYK